MEAGTQGDILYYGASGAPTRLSAGTSGQVLQTGGAGANPSWSSVAGFGASDITSQTDTDVATGDSIVYSDVSDSGNLKKDTIQGVLDLVPVDLNSKADTVITASDKISFFDVSDSDNPKTDTVQGILDLVTTSTTYGAVGTYMFAENQGGGGTITGGSTVAGSNLLSASIDSSGNVSTTGSALSGTWRNMGATAATNETSLFVRIS